MSKKINGFTIVNVNNKYNKYKYKYLELRKIIGGNEINEIETNVLYYIQIKNLMSFLKEFTNYENNDDDLLNKLFNLNDEIFSYNKLNIEYIIYLNLNMMKENIDYQKLNNILKIYCKDETEIPEIPKIDEFITNNYLNNPDNEDIDDSELQYFIKIYKMGYPELKKFITKNDIIDPELFLHKYNKYILIRFIKE